MRAALRGSERARWSGAGVAPFKSFKSLWGAQVTRHESKIRCAALQVAPCPSLKSPFTLSRTPVMTTLLLTSPRPTAGPAAVCRRASVSFRRGSAAPPAAALSRGRLTPSLGRTKNNNDNNHKKSRANCNSLPFPSSGYDAVRCLYVAFALAPRGRQPRPPPLPAARAHSQLRTNQNQQQQQKKGPFPSSTYQL